MQCLQFNISLKAQDLWLFLPYKCDWCMAAASESGEDFSVGGGRVCAAEAASWPVCKTGGGGAKQEDEVIAKVRGGEEGGGRQLRVEPGRVTFVPEMSSAVEAWAVSSLLPPLAVCRLGCGQWFVVTVRDSPTLVEWTRTARRDASVCWHGGRLVFLELLLSQAVETG